MPNQTTEKIYYDPISVAQRTNQKLHLVNSRDKREILLHLIKSYTDLHAVVITTTKREADAITDYLNRQEIHTVSLHGSKRAEQNKSAADAFEVGEVTVLVTTDKILQSLKLSKISHLISYDLPIEPEYYLSRMAVLNEQGEAIALVSETQEVALLDIERVMRHEIIEAPIEGFIPASEPDSTTQPLKEKSKKPRHRKQKKKRTTKTEIEEKA